MNRKNPSNGKPTVTRPWRRTPLLLIAAKELKTALREKLMVVLSLLILVLLGIALYAGHLAYRQQLRIITETQQEKREEWLQQGNKHPHIAAHYGTFVFKPKTVLSIFDFGLDAYTGTSIYLEAHHQHEFMFRPAQDHSSMIRFGELSAALVLQILLPLLVIFLTFGAFTREREQGTLRLLLSQGISYGTLGWGKILAYGLVLTLILLPFVMGILLLSSLGLSSQTIPDVRIRVILLALVYAMYLFYFIAFSVWASLRSTSGRNALLSLLSGWIFFLILMPKTVANFSESTYRLPSIREFKAKIEEDITNGPDGQTPRSLRMAKLEKSYLKKYGVDSIQQLPFNFEGVRLQAGEEYGNQVYDLHLEGLYDIFHRQNRLGSLAGLINPFLAVQHLSMALSGTDLHTFIDFEKEVEIYRRELVRKMNKDMAENSRYGEFFEYEAGKDLWEEIDDFSYRAPSVGKVLQHYQLELLSLIIWTLISLTLLNTSYRKKRIAP